MASVRFLHLVSYLRSFLVQSAVMTPTHSAFKSGSPAPVLSSNPGDGYPISGTLNTTNPGPVSWASAQQGRPTLTGGIPGGRMSGLCSSCNVLSPSNIEISGTPAQITRGSEDVNMLNLDDNRSRRKNTPGEQSMRRSIQDLVSSVDPNVKIEPEVEDVQVQSLSRRESCLTCVFSRYC